MDWTQIIIVIINALLVPIVLWGLAQLSLYLKAKTAMVQEEAHRQLMDSLINRATSLVQIAVMETSQTFVDALKAEGKFDRESAERALEMTKERVYSLLGTEGTDALALAIDDVEAWLTAQIEAAVGQMKR